MEEIELTYEQAKIIKTFLETDSIHERIDEELGYYPDDEQVRGLISLKEKFKKYPTLNYEDLYEGEDEEVDDEDYF